MMRRCYTPQEYAVEKKVTLRTVHRLCRNNGLPPHCRTERIGRQWRIWEFTTGLRGTHAPRGIQSE